MFVFDCERMKYENTGLHVFCDNLASHLVNQVNKTGDDIGFFVPKQYVGRWGSRFYYRTVRNWNKFFLPCDSDVKVWHCAHQQTSYLPPRNVKMVLTVHDLNFLYEKPKYKHRRYLDALQYRLDRADSVVAVSECTKRDLLKNMDLKGKYVEVIYNGLNFFEGDEMPPVVRPEGDFLFSVGTILPKKNFHVLPALLKGNDYKLIIAGNRSKYENDIMAEAQKWGVEDRVFIVGPVDEAVKYWYIRNCSAFLFPSISEGFGLPVIEAMYYGKPIFLSDHTALPEVGGPHAIYFNHEFEPNLMQKEFEEGLKLFKDGSKDQEKMIEHALSFSWERTARRYLEIYRELAD